MKNALIAILVVGIAFLYGSAQPSQLPPAPGVAAHVAIVNVVGLLRDSEAAKRLRKELEEAMKPATVEYDRIGKDIKTWEAAIAARDFRAASKEQYEEKVIEAKRQMEDISRKMRFLVTKKQEDSLRALWKEIETSIRLYATQHGIQLVYGYGEAVEFQDSAININRKIQAMDFGGGAPLYAASGVDITSAILAFMNQRGGDGQAPKGKVE